MKFISKLILFAFFISIQVNAQETCTFNTNSGNRTINYPDFYVELYKQYQQYNSQNSSRYLKSLSITFTKGYLEACPYFHQKILNDVLPSVPTNQNGALSNIIGVLANESLKKDEGYQLMKRNHPKFKRWVKDILR